MFTFRYKAKERGDIPPDKHKSMRVLAKEYLGDANKFTSLQRRISGSVTVMPVPLTQHTRFSF